MSLQDASRLLLWLIISLTAITCYAAENESRKALMAGKPAVRLASKSFFAEPGISPSLIARSRQRSEGSVHAIVQFTKPVSLQTRDLLTSKLGIVLFDPVPDN